jgi:uncharacterized membrane protein (DUF373 family)
MRGFATDGPEIVPATVFHGVDRFTPLLRRVRSQFGGLPLYERFEHAIILLLTLLIIAIVTDATWHLAKSVVWLILTDAVQPANQAVFQTIFGMIFTVIIALEFKHSLLIVLARQESVVRVRSIILIAMLAMVRKFIILDLGEAATETLFALSAAILALGIVYWLVRDQDRKQTAYPARRDARRGLESARPVA